MFVSMLLCLLCRPLELIAALWHATWRRHEVEFVSVNMRFGIACLDCEREFLNEDV